MRFFEEPSMEVVKFLAEDIVTTSGDPLPQPPGMGGNIGDSCIG